MTTKPATPRVVELADHYADAGNRLADAAERFRHVAELLRSNRLGAAEARIAEGLALVESGLESLPRAPPELAEVA